MRDLRLDDVSWRQKKTAEYGREGGVLDSKSCSSRFLAWLGFCIWAILYDFKMGKRSLGWTGIVVFLSPSSSNVSLSPSFFFVCLL